MRKILIWLGITFGLSYFLLGVSTVSKYSINWDEPIHFFRGQAFLNYFLTGEKDYSNLNDFERRSLYQERTFTYKFLEKQFINSDKLLTQGGNLPLGIGHPAFSDLSASFFNFILYQKLGLIGDVDSHHWYSIFLASLLVGYIFYFVSKRFGLFAGIVSGITLSLYPLFIGESRYNTKDIPEAVYYSFAIMFFYNAFTSKIISKSLLWMLASSISFSFAFATKFNVVFFPLIVFPWVIFLLRKKIRDNPFRFLKDKLTLVFSTLLYPFLGLLVFYASWPVLWSKPIWGLLLTIDYYKWIGINPSFDPRFITAFGINTYGVQWILNTTPIIMIIFTVFGLIYAFKNLLKEKDGISFLILFWFLLPIFRVTMPNAGIYGGVRQIMEYIPAMAILSGMGAILLVNILVKLTKVKANIWQALIFILFLSIIFKLASLHPNESLFFNGLNGGLIGAKERDVPGWGNSLGSTYRQGTAWINKNTEKDARVSLVYSLLASIPATDLRSDIDFGTKNRSGLKREGEYAIDLVHSQTRENLYYRKYLERFLNPVYELKVDGAAVLKVWKNDLAHTKKEFQENEFEIYPKDIEFSEGMITIDVGKIQRITKLKLNYNPDSCTLPSNGFFVISRNKENWNRLADDFSSFYFAPWFKPQPEVGLLQFLFAAEEARYIRLIVNDENSCLLRNPISVNMWAI